MVYAVIVCYKPDIRLVVRLCEVLVADGCKIVVVDNTEASETVPFRLPIGCELLAAGFNMGIARAQNTGIKLALTRGADVVVFFDQDSSIEPGFLVTLVSALRPGQPGIVAPVCVDAAQDHELPATRINRFGLPRAVYCRSARQPLPVDIVISSGTAVTKEALELGGAMDEGLFIDYVDTEWCLRCRSMGIPIEVIPDVMMRHTVGRGSINLAIITVFLHNSTRCYYQLRNSLLLFRKSHIPFTFAAREALSIAVSRALLLPFVREKATYLRAYAAAIRDGLKGIVGEKCT